MSSLSETYKRSPLPLYLQVASALRRRIDTGYWEPGAQISTLEELEAEFQVARVTVRQAVEVLQKEGLVHRRQGKGTFVSEEIRDKRWLRLETEWSELISTIEDNVPRFISASDPPPPRIQDGDGKAADSYEFLYSVQSRDGEPFAVAGVHIASDIYKRGRRAFRSRTALPVLVGLKGVNIARAHQTLVIGTADTETAAHLQIPLNAPTAEAHCIVVDVAGVVIYVADIIYRGDCVKLDIDLLNRGG
ncbi:MAG: GntR family transcriptional regulator [Gammaproteobacteria bacterium]|nr:GntR family transcriptional regulator [Gammaproteobacteria bacterium]